MWGMAAFLRRSLFFPFFPLGALFSPFVGIDREQRAEWLNDVEQKKGNP